MHTKWYRDTKTTIPGRPKHGWEDNIKIDLWKGRFQGVEWMDLT